MAKRNENSLESMIREAGWFHGSMKDWHSMSMQERKDAAFAATGCEIAYPTWNAPVDCLHTDCQVRRGELPKIAITNRILRAEIRSGWLRFEAGTRDGRIRIARLCKAIRNACRETGIYDPWDLPGGWQAIVYCGLGS